MRTRYQFGRPHPHRGVRALVVGVALLAAASANASELNLAWSPANGAAAAGYHVYIGEDSGVYDRRIDVGSVLSTTVKGLEDERVYHIAVKAYDGSGRETSTFSPELACLARPRVDSVAPVSVASGRTAYVTLIGANLEGSAYVRSLDPRLRVRSVVPAGRGLIVLVEAAAAPAGEPSTTISLEQALSPVSGCRRADAFFLTHPEVLDVDGNGTIDKADLEAVRESFGARKGDSTYSDTADLDADGSVDGRDMARVIERFATR